MSIIADISALESLQNQANSGMVSIFNAKFVEVDKKLHETDYDKRRMEYFRQKFIEEEQFLIKTEKEYKQKKAKFDKLEKESKSGTKDDKFKREHHRAEVDYVDLRMRRLYSRGLLKECVTKLKNVGIKADSPELNKRDD